MLTYRALDYAYSDLIPRGKYPLAVINITIDPASVDVNIHPTKKELKYSNGNDAYITIQRAITRALREGGRGDRISHGESGSMTVAESGTAFGATSEWATSQPGAVADGSTLDNGSDWNAARDFGDSRFGRGQVRSAGSAARRARRLRRQPRRAQSENRRRRRDP